MEPDGASDTVVVCGAPETDRPTVDLAVHPAQVAGTRWLHKRWTMGLYGPHGYPMRPGHATLRALRMARDLHRRQHTRALEDAFDRHAASAMSSQVNATGLKLEREIESAMRALDMLDYGTSRVSMAQSSARTRRNGGIIVPD